MKLIMTDFYSRILGTSINGLNIYDSFNLKFNNFKEDIKSSINNLIYIYTHIINMIINFKRTNILGNENVPNVTTYDDLKIALDNTAGGAENPLGYSYIQNSNYKSSYIRSWNDMDTIQGECNNIKF